MKIMLDILDCIIDTFGILAILFFLFIAMYNLSTYIGKVLKRQKKIKCLCKHEYEPNAAYYYLNGIEYNFKCRKCGKIISVQTVTDDKFKIGLN